MKQILTVSYDAGRLEQPRDRRWFHIQDTMPVWKRLTKIYTETDLVTLFLHLQLLYI